MDINAVINQIKEFSPIFNGNVAGAAEYAQAVSDQGWLPRPAAYVIPLHDDPEPNQKQTGVYQIVREKVGIIVDLDNSADRRGQAAATIAVRTIRAALFKALLSWRSDMLTQSRGFSYDGGNLLPDGLSRAFLRWQFDFVAETLITDADGWQPSSIPLKSISVQAAPDSTEFKFPLSQT